MNKAVKIGETVIPLCKIQVFEHEKDAGPVPTTIVRVQGMPHDKPYLWLNDPNRELYSALLAQFEVSELPLPTPD